MVKWLETVSSQMFGGRNGGWECSLVKGSGLIGDRERKWSWAGGLAKFDINQLLEGTLLLIPKPKHICPGAILGYKVKSYLEGRGCEIPVHIPS